MRHLSLQTQIRRALTLVDASADRNSTIVDAQNWQALRVIVDVHAVASGGTCTYTLYESNAADMSGATAVPNCEKTIGDTDDGLVFQLDHLSPQMRYYRLTCNKNGTNNVQESAVFELYGPKLIAPTDIATEIASVRTLAELGAYTGS